MRKWIIIFLMHTTTAFFPNFQSSFIPSKSSPDLEEPLFLTPYLEQNQIQEAKNASAVHLKEFGNIASYSGYFTVDKKYNSNLFFWFFPSENKYNEDPVILWLQGGPGASSLYGLFEENGPFNVANESILFRDFSWTKNHSVLYIDQPVGTGFSFTEGHYVKNQYTVAEHLYSALIQFFTMFSELQQVDFFIAGESYAGKYIPAIASYIDTNNPIASQKINLKGILIGNGFTDPIHQLGYGKLLYQLGLIDLNTLEHFDLMETEVIAAIITNQDKQATEKFDTLLSVFRQYTALSEYNFLKQYDQQSLYSPFVDFIQKDEVRQAIHAGNKTFDFISTEVYASLYEDMMKSIATWVGYLLGRYKVLIYNGQLDIIVNYVLTENYLQHLEFDAAPEYILAPRNIWVVNGKVAGYVKSAGNLTDVMVRNAGHMVPADQPESAYDLIFRFIRNISLV